MFPILLGFVKRHLNTTELASCIVHGFCCFMTVCLKTPRSFSLLQTLDFDLQLREDTTFINRISCSNFVYSAAAKPRPSAKNIDIKKYLTPPTQLLFTASATTSIMNFANMIHS